MLVCDSREKWTQHEKPMPNSIGDWFLRHGVEYQVRKLDVGDYMQDGGSVTIDRKQNLDELAKNLTNPKDRSRFYKEIRRSKEKGLKMIILCECGGKVKSIPDVVVWRSEHSPVTGRVLMERIYQVHISYGVEFLFCDKRSTAKRILELLGIYNSNKK